MRFLAVSLSLVAARAQQRILPLGDSITYGCGSSDALPPKWPVSCGASAGGYRAPLYHMLRDTGFVTASGNASFTMVGTQYNGPADIPTYQTANEGHPGCVSGCPVRPCIAHSSTHPTTPFSHLQPRQVDNSADKLHRCKVVAARSRFHPRPSWDERLRAGPRRADSVEQYDDAACDDKERRALGHYAGGVSHQFRMALDARWVHGLQRGAARAHSCSSERRSKSALC